MKKLLLLTFIIILCNTYTVSAAEWTTVEYYDNKIGMPTEPLLERSYEGGYIYLTSEAKNI